eukprot:GEMP01022206.1.p1 GENE.GEMP01022206.1~~GEMP01022206.1.p1  ORF type:complete len:537 (+),score=116.27 GEMP01022206.1:161-1771(+)
MEDARVVSHGKGIPGSTSAQDEAECSSRNGSFHRLSGSGSTGMSDEESGEASSSNLRIRGSMVTLRTRYLYHLGHYPKLVQSFVPNIGPLLQSRHRLVPHLRSPMLPEQARTRPFFGPGGVKSSVINVSAATLGAGALAVPCAFRESGIIAGLIVMFLLVFVSSYSINLLVRVIEMSGFATYEELALHYLGRKRALFLEFNMIFFCFGCAVAYTIVIGSTTQSCLQLLFGADCQHPESTFDILACNKAVPLSIITLVVLLPLSMLDQLNELRFTSLLCVVCILYLILVVIYVFIGTAIDHKLPDHIALMPPQGAEGAFPFVGVIRMVSIAVFAYCCQPNVPGIYVELERRSFRRMTKVSRGSMMLCCAIYVLMGLNGYLTFGSETKGDILQNLKARLVGNKIDMPVALAFVAMIFAVIMSYPLNIFPIRYSIETLVLFSRPQWESKRKLLRVVITVTCVLLSLIFAIIIPGIDKVFGLIGAFSGSIICYIAPALFYGVGMEGSWFSKQKIGALALLVAGVIFMFIGTAVAACDLFI